MKIKTNLAEYIFIPKLGMIINSELENEATKYIPTDVDEGKILEELNRELTDDELESILLSVPSLTLNITEKCNFRCKYCVYSGIYKEPVRSHSLKKMSLSTAKKAIDFLIKKSTDPKRKINKEAIEITFYGGEPLLEINLIKKIVAYTEERTKCNPKLKFKFVSNTNGYLLNEEIIDYIAEKEIGLDISIDGPMEEHDKFRVTGNGRGTWNHIMQNIIRIKNKHPEYYNRKIHYFATVHPHHDLKRIDEFFINRPDLFKKERIKINFFNFWSLKEEISEQIKKELKNKNSRGRSSIDEEYRAMKYDQKLKFRPFSERAKLTGMCFPGRDRLHVEADGVFKICEKVQINLPIGNVDYGIDIDKVRVINNKWRKQIIKQRCWECDFYSICPVCVAQVNDETNFDFTCSFKKNGIKALTDYVKYKESIIQDVNKHQMNLLNYIDQL